MPTIFRYFIIVLSLMYSGTSISQDMPGSETKLSYYLAIKGGISLGNYETGLNRTLLKYVQQNGDRLVAFSGASAGSINSVLSAIDQCVTDRVIEAADAKYAIDDTLDQNFMRYAWDIGIRDLVEPSGDNYKKLYNSKAERKLMLQRQKSGEPVTAGMFSRAGFEKKKVLVEQLIQRGREGCELFISMSVTKFVPEKFSVPEIGTKIPLQRFVIPLRVVVVNGEIRFRNYRMPSADNDDVIPGEYLLLAENDQGFIPFDEIWNLVMASSAFPVAFHPVKLSFCFPHELAAEMQQSQSADNRCTRSRAKEALFSDGGLFDNSPIGVSFDFIDKEANQDRQIRIVYINPDSYRSNVGESKKVKYDSNVGLFEYMDYFLNSFLTAHEAEYKSSIEEILNYQKRRGETGQKMLYMTDRYHHLLADLHAHFGAFYAAEYRLHDYLVGVYDGMNVIAKLECDRLHGQDQGGESFYRCRAEKIHQQLLQLRNRYSLQDMPDLATDEQASARSSLQGSYIFLNYLYDSEFSRSLLRGFPNWKKRNILIALSKSFDHVNRVENSDITYAKFLANLKEHARHIDVSSYPDVSTILQNGRTFTAQTVSKIYENLMRMQDLSAECIFCKARHINDGIGIGFKVIEPVFDSYWSHHETNIWPKPVGDFFGLSYGFNASQKNQVLSADFRWKLGFFNSTRTSLDISFAFNDFGGELGDDDYFSVSAGLIRHNRNILLSSWGLGVQVDGEGDEDIYNEKLNSVFAQISFLDELITLKYVYRTDDVRQTPVQLRDEHAVVIRADVTKVLQMAFPESFRF